MKLKKINLKIFEMKSLIPLIFIAIALSANAQFGFNNPTNEWDASWISVPGIESDAAGLYLFRKALELDSVPQNFEVRVTADNRYKLYVNGTLVSHGPAWNDISHWNYDTIDLAPYLNSGNNIVSAKVWNEGDLKPVAQFSYRTGFLLQGTSEATKTLNTNETWKCMVDESYTPIRQSVRGYYAAGAGERINMNLTLNIT